LAEIFLDTKQTQARTAIDVLMQRESLKHPGV
jgi:hypothetical protein